MEVHSVEPRCGLNFVMYVMTCVLPLLNHVFFLPKLECVIRRFWFLTSSGIAFIIWKLPKALKCEMDSLHYRMYCVMCD